MRGDRQLLGPFRHELKRSRPLGGGNPQKKSTNDNSQQKPAKQVQTARRPGRPRKHQHQQKKTQERRANYGRVREFSKISWFVAVVLPCWWRILGEVRGKKNAIHITSRFHVIVNREEKWNTSGTKTQNIPLVFHDYTPWNETGSSCSQRSLTYWR